MAVELEKIFTRSRFQGGPSVLFLALYTPIGLALLTIRIFISLQICVASLILPSGSALKKFVLRVLYSVMGIVIQEKDSHKKDSKCRVLVSNHISPFDHLAVSLVHPCVSINVVNLPSPLSTVLQYYNFDLTQGRQALRTNIQNYLNKPDSMPLLLYPEGGTTNGEVALMKYIGKFTKDDAESVEEFALRVQKATALSLNLQTSNHTVNDKREYIKRVAREEAMASNPFMSPDINAMALQVREVLPHLPIEAIKRDLVQTRNVDMTITNFLEGNAGSTVHSQNLEDSFSPEIDHRPTSSGDISPQSINSSSPFVGSGASGDISLEDLNMAAKTFGTSATERIRSFEERKDKLIAMARQRYLQKHGLTSVDSTKPC
ncbi:Ancient ubiquitous protein 1 [Armadillidium nasatum]|uniref:Lipid droplet-regulating VLDL assembly factor AUP1 n=1 Tax=Armadillidium nasatum TaxID=96803 RepID=A0A5N5T7E5_9CRUS|nr:Ancient ubiquitous protein 1 [Armadillidium nasatum]